MSFKTRFTVKRVKGEGYNSKFPQRRPTYPILPAVSNEIVLLKVSNYCHVKWNEIQCQVKLSDSDVFLNKIRHQFWNKKMSFTITSVIQSR